MADAYISRRGGGGGIKYFPMFTGDWNLVLSKDGKSGYAEFFSDGTLTWRDGKVPPTVDITCVGAGGGGSAGSGTASIYRTGAGGAGGYVNSVTEVTINDVELVAVGKGGTEGHIGSSTNFGSACYANGGGTPSVYGTYGSQGASGGNAGGVGGIKVNSTVAAGAEGCYDGLSPAAVGNSTYQAAGTSQGTSTSDILERIHAGGGGAGKADTNPSSDDVNETVLEGFAGGESDCERGKGQDGSPDVGYYHGKGGGGHGGGGGGGGMKLYSTTVTFYPAGSGGDGLVVLGWGNYLYLYYEVMA